ncbi:MAG: glycosyltransferase [Acidobacteria bacterium]|nr:glycosyltransferase [Acidobacteriota bacterium]
MNERAARGPQIVLLGHFGAGNAGDNAILLGSLALLRSRITEGTFLAVSSDPAETAALVPDLTVIDAGDAQTVLTALRTADLVIVGGGGIYHDYLGFSPLAVLNSTEPWARMLYAYPLLACMLGRPTMMLAHGIGPLPFPDGRAVVGHLANACDLITVRDVQSKDLLVRLGVATSKVFVTADSAYCLSPAPDAETRRVLEAAGVPAGSFIAVSVRPWEVPGAPVGWEVPFAAALGALSGEVGLPVVLVPFQTKGPDDRVPAEQIRAAIDTPLGACVLGDGLRPEVIAGVLRMARMVVGMRLHALILATAVGTPSVGVAYDPKVSYQMEKIGALDRCVSLDDVRRDHLYPVLRATWDRLESLREVTAAAGAAERTRAALNADLAAVLLRRCALRGRGEVGGRRSDVERQWLLQAQQEAALSALRQEVANLESALQAARGEASRHEQAAAALAAELRVVYGLRRWRIASQPANLYWTLRKAFKGELVRPRLYNLGRKVLPSRVKTWVKRVLPGERRTVQEHAVHAGDDSGVPATPRTSAYDVVYFPVIDWEFRYQRPQHLCSQFADHGHRVFHVRTTFLAPDDPDLSIGPRTYALRQPRERVYEIGFPGPPALSVYRDRLSAEMTDVLVRCFAELRRDEHLRDVMCLVALPFWKPLVLRLKEVFGWTVVYDCMDDHGGFETNDPSMVTEEVGLTARSDLVVTTARSLMARLSQISSRCVLIPNACEFDHFAVSVGALPPMYERIPRPIVGYYGAISTWFDVDLVASLATQRRGWSFVLIGATAGADVRTLQALPNVHLLGEIPYADLPTHLHQFDVCIIPFKAGRLTEATNPVKLYEYLSAGKPVVTVPLPEVMPFVQGRLAYAASGEAEFLTALELALREDSAERRAARVAFSSSNTWAERFAALKSAIAGCLPKASIVVVTYDNLPLTRDCLESIWRHTLYPNYEVVVVDNGSADGTQDYLAHLEGQHSNLRVVLNRENRGFSVANNQGIVMTSGDVVVLLNNDTIVTRGWLGGLLLPLRRDRTIGMVGPVTNSAGNEACIPVSYTQPEQMHIFAEHYCRQHEGEMSDLLMLGMFCVAIRRDVLQQVGLLDERFGVGMFEDDDYSMRVKAAGYRTVCVEDVFVHHHGRSAMKRLDGPEYDALFERNRSLFERKWQIVWERHRSRAPTGRVR